MRSHNQQRQARSNLLVSRARRMLHAPTASEEALWQALRGGALGVPFKRQVVLGGRYIADFFAPSVGLVVEVDGGVHRSTRSADRRRDEKLQRLGYRVVRIEAALVLRAPEEALAVIRSALLTA
jgi:very-short-patch-repair endonuclease